MVLIKQQQKRANTMIDLNMLTRVNNDTNGNPRYVIHFLNLLTRAEKCGCTLFEKCGSIQGDRYEVALKRSRQLGGKKFHNKQYGGGIVFQSYNTGRLIESIQDLISDLNDAYEMELAA